MPESNYYSLNKLHVIIEVSGPDAAKFLQGQLSCDINQISQQQAQRAVHCNLQGRVIADFYIFLAAECYLLITSPGCIETTIKSLKKYARFSKVNIVQQSDEWQMLGLLNATSLPDDALQFELEAAPARQLVLLPKNTELPQDFIADTEQHWRLLNIRAGFAHIQAETSEQFTPHVLNYHLTDVLNFNKGCYTGQEIIARMHYRGKPKQSLYYAKIDANDVVPKIGDKLINQTEQQVGFILDAIKHENKIELLCTLKHSAVTEVFYQQNSLQDLTSVPQPSSQDLPQPV